MRTDFLVRVKCYTYNHSHYITDALNGFCMQQTTFPFVCTIVDDASTDGEQEVIQRYLVDFFDLNESAVAYSKETCDCRIVFARHKSNENCFFAVVFLKENHYKIKSKDPYVIDWRDTKYIALCEGDDYWIDSQKLQKQVSYMEKHNECVMCTHAAYWSVEGEKKKWGCVYEEERDLTTDEVVRNGGRYLATCSLVFRRVLYDDKPEWRLKSDVGDYPLQILGSLRGALHFFPEIMCVYRFQVDGSWTFRNKQTLDLDHIRTEIEWLEMFNKETDYIYSRAVNYHLFPYYSSLYRLGEVSFRDYLHSAKLSQYYLFKKKVIKDFLYKNCYPLYKQLIK